MGTQASWREQHNSPEDRGGRGGLGSFRDPQKPPLLLTASEPLLLLLKLFSPTIKPAPSLRGPSCLTVPRPLKTKTSVLTGFLSSEGWDGGSAQTHVLAGD